jgi:hypothetical protein
VVFAWVFCVRGVGAAVHMPVQNWKPASTRSTNKLKIIFLSTNMIETNTKVWPPP